MLRKYDEDSGFKLVISLENGDINNLLRIYKMLLINALNEDLANRGNVEMLSD